MKKAVLILALLPTFSFAQESLEGAYAGIELGILNSIELELQGASNDTDIDNFPVNINAGYDVALAPNVTIGFEAEYRWLGEGKYKDGGQTLLKVSGQGLSFNLRPKFHIKNSPIYVGLLAGIGQYRTEATVYTNTGNESDNSTDTGWQYGAELGYRFQPNMVATIGYRAVKIDLDSDFDFTATHSGFNLGIQYRF